MLYLIYFSEEISKQLLDCSAKAIITLTDLWPLALATKQILQNDILVITAHSKVWKIFHTFILPYKFVDANKNRLEGAANQSYDFKIISDSSSYFSVPLAFWDQSSTSDNIHVQMLINSNFDAYQLVIAKFWRYQSG